MILIALAIVVLVLCSKYKQTPTTSKRTGVTVTTIITAILSFFELISVVTLGILNGLFGGDEFRELIYDAVANGDFDYDSFATMNEAVDFVLSMVTVGLIVAIVFCVLITAFGIFASVIGFKTIADKTLTAAAAQNTAAQQQAYAMPNYRNNCNSSYQGGYGYQSNGSQPYQSNYNNSYGQPQQYQQNYQTPMQNNTAPTGQPINANVNANTATHSGEWYCVCGNKNAPEQKFCSNCGAANPNISK